MPFPLYLAILGLLGLQTPATRHPGASRASVVLLTQAARDSMNIVFRHFNQHWDELADLTTLERMLGTIRPTQLPLGSGPRDLQDVGLSSHPGGVGCRFGGCGGEARRQTHTPCGCCDPIAGSTSAAIHCRYSPSPSWIRIATRKPGLRGLKVAVPRRDSLGPTGYIALDD